MANQLQNWVEAHDPRFSGPEGIHVAAETAVAINKAQGLVAAKSIAKTVLDGPDAAAAAAADEEVAKLYKESGPSGQVFIAAFGNAPVTGAATMLDMARTRANFDPATGNDSLAAFNAYIQSCGQIPIFTLASNKSGSINKTFPTMGDTLDAITDMLFASSSMSRREKNTFSDRVEKAVQMAGSDGTVDLTLYVTELVAGTSIQFLVSGAKLSLNIATEKSILHERGKRFTLSGNNYHLVFEMLTGEWNADLAATVAAKHFATIDQWAKSSSSY